jgi:hypothetical protein
VGPLGEAGIGVGVGSAWATTGGEGCWLGGAEGGVVVGGTVGAPLVGALPRAARVAGRGGVAVAGRRPGLGVSRTDVGAGNADLLPLLGPLDRMSTRAITATATRPIGARARLNRRHGRKSGRGDRSIRCQTPARTLGGGSGNRRARRPASCWAYTAASCRHAGQSLRWASSSAASADERKSRTASRSRKA